MILWGNIEKNEKWFVLLLNHININCHTFTQETII